MSSSLSYEIEKYPKFTLIHQASEYIIGVSEYIGVRIRCFGHKIFYILQHNLNEISHFRINTCLMRALFDLEHLIPNDTQGNGGACVHFTTLCKSF